MVTLKAVSANAKILILKLITTNEAFCYNIG